VGGDEGGGYGFLCLSDEKIENFLDFFDGNLGFFKGFIF
jgi:hypothetical protein